MSLLTVAVILLVTESYGYLSQNTAQTQRDKTTQRSEELGAAFGHNQKQPPKLALSAPKNSRTLRAFSLLQCKGFFLCALRSSALSCPAEFVRCFG